MIALSMLAAMIVGIFIGIPVAFTLIFLALGFGYAVMGHNVFDLAYYNLIGGLSDEVFMAIPMFIFMGYICERAGLVERLFDSLKTVVGNLYIVVIVMAVFISLATGVVGASVTLLGIMAAPHMMRLGYNPKLTAGVIAGGGSMIMIPPSVPLIVMAPTMNLNIIDLYAGALVPGLMIAAMYIIYVSFFPRPKSDEKPQYGRVLIDVLPLTFLIAMVLGSMLFGLATSTEAGAFGAFGALILATLNGKLFLKEALLKTCDTTSVVMLLALASIIFGAVFTSLGGDTVIVNALNTLPIPPWALVGCILVICFLIGYPMEWAVVVLVFLPIFMPVLIASGVDMLWFAVCLGIVLQTAYLTPPVALTAYYLKKAVPTWDLGMIFKSMMPFMWMQVLAVIILFLAPGIATWFPNYLKTDNTSIINKIEGEIAFPSFENMIKEK
jgi:tripartite ATP-independent transporter DctM subunit